MDSMMPPPMLPAYSLRVRIYAPDAYGIEDLPLRSIRVVTDPTKTIQQFCEQALRQQTAAYGAEIAVKKCQDDQGFDLMQNEVLGSLFASGQTIRIVQAYTVPSVRDSVPPTSALRFEPPHMLGKRRERPDSSPKTNGILPPPVSYKPNKRQRIADFNPDHPLPSLEEEGPQLTQTAEPNVIPNSQESVDLGAQFDGNDYFRGSHVRPDFLRHRLIEETPPPNQSSPSAGGSADTFRDKKSSSRRSVNREIPESSPVIEAQQRGRIASSHGPRLSEARRSASAPKQLVKDSTVHTNGQTADGNGQASQAEAQSRRQSGRRSSVTNEDVYEQMPNGEEGVAVLKAKKAELNKLKHTPSNGRFNTPPSLKRPSRDRSTPGELPLTPNSRREVQREKDDAEEARRARMVAAEVAEQRRKANLEVQRLERARLEEQERLELEERIRVEAEEQRRLEEAREKAREQREAAQQASQDRRIEEGLVEAEKVLGTEFELPSPVVETAKAAQFQRPKHVSPAVIAPSNGVSNPSELRRSNSALSSTPYIPTGRKSAMKSSPLASPALSSPSFTGIGIDHNMPLPRSRERKVSFHGVPDDNDMPSRPAVKTPLVVTPHLVGKKKQKLGSVNTEAEANLVNTVTRKTKSITPDQNKTNSITPRQRSQVAQDGSGSLKQQGEAVKSDMQTRKSITPLSSAKPSTPQPASSAQNLAYNADPRKQLNLEVAPKNLASTVSTAVTSTIVPRSATGAILPPRTRIIPAARPAYKIKAEQQEIENKSRSSSPRTATRVTSNLLARPSPGLSRKSDGKLPASQPQIQSQPLPVPVQRRQEVPAEPSEESSSSGESDTKSASAEEARSAVTGQSEDNAESDSEEEVEVEAEAKRVETAREARDIISPLAQQSASGTRRSSKSSTSKPLEASPQLVRRSITPRVPSKSPILSRRSTTPKAFLHTQPVARLGSPEKIDDDTDIETQSHDSSVRDSRSPVTFAQQEQEEQDGSGQAIPPAAMDQGDESSSSESEGDIEMPDASTYTSPKSKAAKTPNHQSDIASSRLSSPTSSDSDSEDGLPVPKLTPRLSTKSATISSNVANPLRSTLFHHLVSPSNTDSNASPASSIRTNDTQDEVDYQLISSVHEASSPASRPSLTQPAQLNRVNRVEKLNKSSPARPPAIQFGSSLTSLNARKVVPVSQLGVGSGLKSVGKPLLKSTGRDDSDDSSSDSGDDDDSDAESDTLPAAKPSQIFSKVAQQPQRSQPVLKEISTDDEDASVSGSESGSEEEDEEEDSPATKIRKELMAEVAKLHASQGSSQSPVLSRKKR